MFLSLFISLSLLSVKICTAQLQQCHRKDTSVVPDLPCDPSARVSTCCGQGFKCATSLYCEAKDGFKLVGSCTDPTWMNPACPFIQLNSGNHRFNATLNTTDCHDGTTCPNAKNETCCANKEGVSVISFHNTGLIPSTVTALTSYYSAGGYTIPTTTPGASLTELLASATASASPTSTSTSSSSLSSGAKAGIGVGAAVGAVAVTVLAFLLFRHFQKRRSTRQTPSYENIRSTDGMIVPNYGPGKHEMVGQGVAMQDYRKHELSGQSVTPQDVKKDAVMGQPARLETDAASPERNRFHELNVDG